MPLPPFRTNALAGWLVALIVLALVVSIGLVSLT